MTISIVILSVVAILLFFGVVEKYFDRLGLTSWLAFLIIITLLIGTVTPDLSYSVLRLTFGGFVFPLIGFAVILGVSIKKIDLIRTLSTMTINVAMVLSLRLFVGVDEKDAVLIVTILSGISVAIATYLIVGSRLGGVCACFGAFIFGDVVWAIVRYVMNPTELIIGGYGTLDGLVLSVAICLALFEVVYTVKNFKVRSVTKSTLDVEASDDVTLQNISSEKEEKDEEDDRI